MKVEVFHSPFCEHCIKVRSIISDIAEKFGAGLEVEEVNILSTEGRTRANQSGVRGVPTVILDSDAKLSGEITFERLESALRRKMQEVAHRVNMP